MAVTTSLMCALGFPCRSAFTNLDKSKTGKEAQCSFRQTKEGARGGGPCRSKNKACNTVSVHSCTLNCGLSYRGLSYGMVLGDALNVCCEVSAAYCGRRCCRSIRGQETGVPYLIIVCKLGSILTYIYCTVPDKARVQHHQVFWQLY